MNRKEPITADDGQQYIIFPVRYKSVNDRYKVHLRLFWIDEAIKEEHIQQDARDIHKVPNEVAHFIKRVLGFFAASDGIVSENLCLNFMAEIKDPGVNAFYGIQKAIEDVHAITYHRLLDGIVQDPVERAHLRDAIHTIPSIKAKADWAIRHVRDDLSLAHRMVAFSAIEGINFCSSFAAIFFLKEQYPSLFPATTESNQYISRDESMHAEFAVHMFTNILQHTSDVDVKGILLEAAALEEQFVRDSLPTPMVGMNADLMIQYVRYVTDQMLSQYGLPAHFGASNPFPFMTRLVAQTRVLFFEQESTNYSIGGNIVGYSPKYEVNKCQFT